MKKKIFTLLALLPLVCGCMSQPDPAPLIEAEEMQAREFGSVVEFARKLSAQTLTEDARRDAEDWLDDRVDAYEDLAEASVDWLAAISEIDPQAVYSSIRGILVDVGAIEPVPRPALPSEGGGGR